VTGTDTTAGRREFAAYQVADALADAGLLVDERGGMPPWLNGITDDSRRVGPGALFVAVRGSSRDGHDFIDAAARAGAAGVVAEDATRTRLPAFVVRDGRAAAAVAAAAAYDFPGEGLRTIGVTGTNGKSTTVGILRHLLDDPVARSASVGTIGVFIGSEGELVENLASDAGLTTPGPIELQGVLRVLADRGVRTVAIEVSSHSLDQRRIEGLSFDAVAFTNLTRDHLDYHGTMDAYFAAKSLLLSYLKPGGVAVINADDAAWHALPPIAHRVTFSGAVTGDASDRADVDVRAASVRFGPRGSEWDLVVGGRSFPVRLPLIGDFNVANALGAAAVAWGLGMAPDLVARRLSSAPQVPGRLEVISESPSVLRDYAHTPDALDRALSAVRPFTRGRLLVVFGAGGDRDRGKRPLMGAAAERLADLVILTSDNPRTEDPGRILDEIEAGMTRPHERIEDRETAVARALAIARPDDLVLLAGKGHETYQVRGETRYPCDERAIVRRILAGRV
jgi:UDP-N-acetylmuramoyl-L-alanyl-D-glutamate--2,6-diaminopimelate ligase